MFYDLSLWSLLVVEESLTLGVGGKAPPHTSKRLPPVTYGFLELSFRKGRGKLSATCLNGKIRWIIRRYVNFALVFLF